MKREEMARSEALRRYEILNTPPEPNFDRITRIAAQVLRRPVCTLALADRDRFWFKSRFGVDATEIPRSMAFCEQTIAGDDVFVVADAAQDPRFAAAPVVAGPPHLRFYAGAPLVTPSGVRVGSLCVLDPVPSPGFSPDERRLLSDLAATAVELFEARARQIEFTRCTEEIAHMARHDALTGLANRTHLAELFAEAEAEAQARGHALALIYLDLDGFKAVNDGCGHDGGDALLREVAARLREALPPGASVARVGGDEFVVLLSGDPGRLDLQALALARRLVERLRMPLGHVIPGLATGSSAGIAVGAPGPGLAPLLGRADAALYRAKKQGRGRCVLSEAPGASPPMALCG